MAWKIEENIAAETRTVTELALPADYKVILYNDDYTTKDFVVSILISVFNKSAGAAVELMEAVHSKGAAVIGVYSFDIASTLADCVVKHAREKGFPLRCELEGA